MSNVSPLSLASDATDDASDRSIREGAANTNRTTKGRKALSERRKAAGPVAARIVSRAMTEVTGGFAAVARRLECSPTLVTRWADDTEEGRPAHLRDLIAGGPALMRAVGRELIAQADAIESDGATIKRSPTEHAIRIGAVVGDLHRLVSEIMEDGIVDANEARRLRVAIRDLLTAARKAKRDVEPTV